MDCWQKLKDFHDFCIRIENIHLGKFNAGTKCGESYSSSNILQVETDDEFKLVVQQEEEEIANPVVITTGPRKRGRPRKTPLHERPVNIDATNKVHSTGNEQLVIPKSEESINNTISIADEAIGNGGSFDLEENSTWQESSANSDSDDYFPQFFDEIQGKSKSNGKTKRKRAKQRRSQHSRR